jgi:hypothetical protein
MNEVERVSGSHRTTASLAPFSAATPRRLDTHGVGESGGTPRFIVLESFK